MTRNRMLATALILGAAAFFLTNSTASAQPRIIVERGPVVVRPIVAVHAPIVRSVAVPAPIIRVPAPIVVQQPVVVRPRIIVSAPIVVPAPIVVTTPVVAVPAQFRVVYRPTGNDAWQTFNVYNSQAYAIDVATDLQRQRFETQVLAI